MPMHNGMLARVSAFIPPIVDSLVWGLDGDDRDVLLLPRLLQCLAILHLVMTMTMMKLPRMDLRVVRLCMSSTRSRLRMTWIGKVVSYPSNGPRMLADHSICTGREDAFITRALLAQLAQRLHGHQQIVLGGGEEDEDGEATIVFNNDEGCNVQ